MEPEGNYHRNRGVTYAVESKPLEHVFEPPASSSTTTTTTSPLPPSTDDVSCFTESLEVAEEASSSSSSSLPPDDSSSIFFSSGFLSFASRDLVLVPPFLSRFAPIVKKLDLSFNSLVNVKGLDAFFALEELVLDNNSLDDDVVFPNLTRLATLSLNKNRLVDLDRVVSMCRWKFPSLTFLSLVGNQCCPSLNLLDDEDEEMDDYQRYRYLVVHKLPGLNFLDFTPVSASERQEALRRGQFLSTVKIEEKDLEELQSNPSSSSSSASTLSSMAATSSMLLRRGRKSGGGGGENPFSPLPPSEGGAEAAKDTKEAYGKCRYVYFGKQSEGNRFIGNNTL